MLISILAVAIFGAAYLLSWHIEFPKSTGQTWWRACSVSVIVSTLTLIAITWYTHSMDAIGRIRLVCYALVCLYVMARTLLALQLVYSFYSLPVGVYDIKDVEWLEFIPFLH